jgi:hypothetical protein
MPLNLVEIKSLIGALGVKIPDDILQQKAKAEEFEERRKKIAGDAGSKAPEWYLKARYDAALKAADEASGKKQFVAAFKQLEECERLLKEPEIAPEVVAALKQLEERKKVCEAEIARVKALESPIGGDLKAALEAVSNAIKEFDAKTAEKRLAEVEKSVKAYAEKKAAEEAALAAARVRVDALKAQVEKELKETDIAVKAIGEPTLAAPEAQKLEALTKRQTIVLGLSDLTEQEKDLSALLLEIAALKNDVAAAKVKADELKATKLRVTQKFGVVDAALIELQKVVDGLKEKALKDGLTPQVTPLTQERARIGTLTVPSEQESALTKLEKDVAAVKKTADNRASWDAWLKDKWEKDSKNTKDWIGDLKQVAPQGILKAEFDAVQQEKANFLAAANYSAMQKTSHPKLIKIYQAANRIEKHGPEVDLEVHKLRNLVIAVRDGVSDRTVTRPITVDFDALANEKKQSWPVGSTAAAIAAAIDDFDLRVAALRARAETVRSDFVGGDLAHRAKEIEKIKEAMDQVDQMLSEIENQDWIEVAKQPPEQSGPLLKMKTEFDVARKTYKDLAPRLKKLLPYAKRNSSSQPRAVGQEVVKLGKEVSALLEQVMRRFMKASIKLKGVAELDKMIADMPDHANDPNELAVCKAIIEARFGVKIEVGEEFKAKSLPRIGKMLARVPDWQTKQSKQKPDGSPAEKSLKTLTYQSEPSSKGNYYSSSRKMIALQDMTEKGTNDEHTLVADSGKVVKTSYFDFTTLHEIGHAVDDRVKFMSSRMEKDGFGKWKKETFESVLGSFLPTLVTDCTGGAKKAQAADLEAMLTDLIKTGNCTKPANATAKLGSLFAEWDQIQNHAVVVKCKEGVYTKAKPWNKGKAHADAVEFGGRVYQEAYDNDWYSYALADRATTGVTKYQWRAPGEWFAEIYALYYLNKLSRSHPMSGWFRTAAKSEAKAMKT